MKKKSKSKQRDAKWANSTPALVNIEQLSQLKNIPVRSLRSMVAKGVLSRFKWGHRSQFFSPEQFDRDISKFLIKSVTNRKAGK